MTINRKNAEAFARQFSPPLTVVKTEAIDGKKIPDAWNVSYWDASRKVGIVAHAFGGQFKAYIEAGGPGEIAQSAGKVMAQALGMFKEGK